MSRKSIRNSFENHKIFAAASAFFHSFEKNVYKINFLFDMQFKISNKIICITFPHTSVGKGKIRLDLVEYARALQKIKFLLEKQTKTYTKLSNFIDFVTFLGSIKMNQFYFMCCLVVFMFLKFRVSFYFYFSMLIA